jgi:hypothetical protein
LIPNRFVRTNSNGPAKRRAAGAGMKKLPATKVVTGGKLEREKGI